MGEKRNTYSKEYKLNAVEMYLSGEHGGYDSITAKLGLPSKVMIRRWVKNYREFGEEGLAERRGTTRLPGTGRPRTKKPLTLEEEVAYLRAQNYFLKKLWEKRKG
jgi:transposase